MKKVAFLFPGQGSQYIGMSKELCNNFYIADQTFEEASDVLDMNLKELCFEGEISTLTKTQNAQPAILTASVAAYRVYMKEIGVDAKFSIGHSLGEISALCCAGSIEFKTAVELIKKRAEFMSNAQPEGFGKMAAVGGLGSIDIENICKEISKEGSVVVCANYNSPDQIVISGENNAVENASRLIKSNGGYVIPLKVSGAFHSPLMESAALEFQEELKKTRFNKLKRAVISNYTALPYTNNDFVTNLTKQIISPVRFVESLNYLKHQGVELAIEMGPKQVLKGLCKKTIPDVKALSFDIETDFDAVKLDLSSVDKEEFDGNCFLKICVCDAVCTRNMNFNEEEYQKGVVENYKDIVNMRSKYEENKKSPSISELKIALNKLKEIFDTKMVTNTEQKMLLDELLDRSNTRSYFQNYCG